MGKGPKYAIGMFTQDFYLLLSQFWTTKACIQKICASLKQWDDFVLSHYAFDTIQNTFSCNNAV